MSWLMGPSISNAIGSKVHVDDRLRYLDAYPTAEASVAVPAMSKVVGKYLWAMVSVMVPSKTRFWQAH